MRERILNIIIGSMVILFLYCACDMFHWFWQGKTRVERIVYQAIDDETKFITTKEGISTIVYDTLKAEHLLNMEEYFEWKCDHKGEGIK